MLKCASVFTYELDNPEVALKEIKTQLDEKIKLQKNSVGIIMCHPEFTRTEVLKYVCDNLPFDVAGITTSSQAVNGEAGEMLLTIFVMTADDVWFKSGVTECVEQDMEGPTVAAFKKATAGEKEQPKLALIFPPLILKYSGDEYVYIWDRLLPNVPIYGTIAIDDTVAFSESETIYNGVNYKTSGVFILCYGNINPRFIIGTLPENNNLPYKGEITKSESCFVSEVNNINAYKYFENLGFAKDGAPTDSFLFVPFLIDQKQRKDYDGIPVMRVLATFTENGTAIFRGNVDENSTFTLLKCLPEDVLGTTEIKLDEISKMQDVNGVILLSCIIRRMVSMRVDSLSELNAAKDKLGDIPFMMAYAGGEICPTSIKNNKSINRFHNYSLIILVI